MLSTKHLKLFWKKGRNKVEEEYDNNNQQQKHQKVTTMTNTLEGIDYTLTTNGIQFMLDGKVESISKENDEYNSIIDAVENDDRERLRNIMDKLRGVKQAYQSNDVEVKHGAVYYRDQKLSGDLPDRIIEASRDGRKIDHMVKFLENLMENPSRSSREQLFNFMTNVGIPITQDGHFKAYKTVAPDYYDKYSNTYENKPGNVIEMERREVDDDPNRTCSYGFHVGNWSYAGPGGWYNSSSDRVVVVKVNPRDAVAVPKDHDLGKLRVSRYEVVGEIPNEQDDQKRRQHMLDDSFEVDNSSSTDSGGDDGNEQSSNNSFYSDHPWKPPSNTYNSNGQRLLQLVYSVSQYLKDSERSQKNHDEDATHEYIEDLVEREQNMYGTEFEVGDVYRTLYNMTTTRKDIYRPHYLELISNEGPHTIGNLLEKRVSQAQSRNW